MKDQLSTLTLSDSTVATLELPTNSSQVACCVTIDNNCEVLTVVELLRVIHDEYNVKFIHIPAEGLGKADSHLLAILPIFFDIDILCIPFKGLTSIEGNTISKLNVPYTLNLVRNGLTKWFTKVEAYYEHTRFNPLRLSWSTEMFLSTDDEELDGKLISELHSEEYKNLIYDVDAIMSKLAATNFKCELVDEVLTFTHYTGATVTYDISNNKLTHDLGSQVDFLVEVAMELPTLLPSPNELADILPTFI